MTKVIFSKPSEKTRNFHRNYLYPYHQIAKIINGQFGEAKDIHKQTVKAFQDQILTKAINEGRRVKIKGSKWSLSEAPYCKDFVVDIYSLTKVITLESMDFHASYVGDKTNLVFIQSGRKIKAISDYLFSKGKSLSTSGASNGQTISGAIGTGVHGSAFDYGSTQEMIVGLHIVTSEKKSVYLERSSDSYLSNQFSKSINATDIKDDKLFNAALVGIGSCGYLLGVTLKVEDLYHFDRHILTIDKIEAIKLGKEQKFENSPLLPSPGTRPYHYKLYGNPYKPNDKLIAEILYKIKYDPSKKFDKKKIDISYYGDIPAFIGKIINLHGASTKTFANVLATVLLPNTKEKVLTGTSAEIFGNTGTKGSVFGFAFGVDVKDVERIYNAMATLIATDNVPGLISIRYVKGTKAILGFTRFPKTAIIEVDGVKWNDLDKFLRKMVNLVDNGNIEFTLHWGKNAPWNSALVNKMYPTQLKEWKESRNKLIPTHIRKLLKNKFTDNLGLT